MDPAKLKIWLLENGHVAGPYAAEQLANALCEEYVMRKRQPPLAATAPFRHKWAEE